MRWIAAYAYIPLVLGFGSVMDAIASLCLKWYRLSNNHVEAILVYLDAIDD